MKSPDKNLLYLSLMTESGLTSSQNIYEDVIDYYSNNTPDIKTELIDGIKDAGKLEPMEQLRIYDYFSSNDKLCKSIIKYHADNPDADIFASLPGIINELLSDEKNADSNYKIIQKVASNLDSSIAKLEKGDIGNNLRTIIRRRTIETPPFLNFLRQTDNTPVISNDATPNAAVLNEESIPDEEIDLFISMMQEGGATIVDKSKKVAVAADKKVEAFSDMLNRIKKNYEQTRKQESQEKIITGSIGIKRQLRRILKSVPFAIAGPGFGFLAYIGLSLVDKKLDKDQRSEIVGDLKLEIRLIDDKISDAEGAGDKVNKAKLTRQKDELERTLERMMKNKV